MDETIFRWFNGWNGRSELLDIIIFTLQSDLIKSVPFMLVFWGLFFWPKTIEHRTRVRESLVAVLVCAVPIIGITRGVANYAPFSNRPIHTPELEINLHDDQSVEILDGWSSMPSDHASLFLGLAVAILTIHRTAGVFFDLMGDFYFVGSPNCFRAALAFGHYCRLVHRGRTRIYTDRSHNPSH